MSLLNYSTKIEPEQTISEMQKMLSEHGVSAMMTEYDGRQVSAVSFRINVNGQQRAFRMPCNWRAVKLIFDADPKIRNTKYNSDEQAIRTAWRIICVWIKAQLALVEVNMVSLPQIFLPFTIMKNGNTLSENIDADPGFLIE